MGIKSKPTRTTSVGEWCKDCIHGTGGFLNWEKYELVVHHHSRELTITEWVIRCLGNKDNEGSQMVIDAILEQRKK